MCDRLNYRIASPLGAGVKVSIALNFADNILAISDAKTGATVPVDKDRSDIVNELHGSLFSGRQLRKWIAHRNEFYACPGWICFS